MRMLQIRHCTHCAKDRHTKNECKKIYLEIGLNGLRNAETGPKPMVTRGEVKVMIKIPTRTLINFTRSAKPQRKPTIKSSLA